MEGVFYIVLTVKCSKRLWISLLSFLWAPVADELLPPDDWTIELYVFVTFFLCWNSVVLVDEKKDD